MIHWLFHFVISSIIDSINLNKFVSYVQMILQVKVYKLYNVLIVRLLINIYLVNISN